MVDTLKPYHSLYSDLLNSAAIRQLHEESSSIDSDDDDLIDLSDGDISKICAFNNICATGRVHLQQYREISLGIAGSFARTFKTRKNKFWGPCLGTADKNQRI